VTTELKALPQKSSKNVFNSSSIVGLNAQLLKGSEYFEGDSSQ